jgi:hypothetical protein
MSNNNQLTTIQEAAPVEWGNREEVATIARRLRAMLPNGAKLTESQLFAAAQYAQLTGLNPFSRGFYTMPGGGIVDHYGTLVNWAQSKDSYSDKYFRLTLDEKEAEGIPPDADAWKCYILKDSRQAILLQYLQAGLPLVEALELAASRGVGFVTQADKTGKDGRSIAPPKNWTWDKVAQKRALRAALSLSHGTPTAQELATLSWRVGDVETTPADWQDQPGHVADNRELSERYAALQALERERLAAGADLTPVERRERLADNVGLMRGPADEAIGEDSAQERQLWLDDEFGSGTAGTVEP